MSRRIPIFPLSTVLFPGLMLPLHIFEERYRVMIKDLMGRAPRRAAEFGIVAIKHGHESGPVQLESLYRVGCVARVRRINEVSGGRYDIVTTGTERFRLVEVDEERPYLSAVVEPMDDPLGAPSAELTEQVYEGFTRYLDLISSTPVDELVREVPHDPRALSYLVAATMALPLPDRQRLLEEPDAAHRLQTERRLLTSEIGLISAFGALPATDLTRVGFSMN